MHAIIESKFYALSVEKKNPPNFLLSDLNLRLLLVLSLVYNSSAPCKEISYGTYTPLTTPITGTSHISTKHQDFHFCDMSVICQDYYTHTMKMH